MAAVEANGKYVHEPVKANGVVGSAVGRHWSEYGGKKFGPYSAFVVVAGAMTGLLLGYDNGVMGGVTAMESFQHKFFYDTVYYNNYIAPEATTAYFIFYAPVLFASLANGALGGLLNTVIVDAVNVLATLVCIALLDRVGRRKLLLVASAWMFVTQIIVCGLLGYYFSVYGQSLPSNVSVGILVVICVYIAGHAFGWGPIGWVYPTEVQPLETRPAGAAINVASNLLFTFVIGQTFTTMLCSMHEYVFLFFAICLIVMGVVVYFLYPETMGTPVERTWRVFQDNKYWMRMCPAIREVHTVALPPPEADPVVAPTLGAAARPVV